MTTHRPEQKCGSSRRRGDAADLAAAVPAQPRPGRPSPAVHPRGARRRCLGLRAPGRGVGGDASGGREGGSRREGDGGGEAPRPRGPAAQAPPRPLLIAGACEPDAVRGRKMHHGMNPSPGDGFLEQQQQQPPPPRRLLAAVLWIQLALCFGPAQLTGGE